MNRKIIILFLTFILVLLMFFGCTRKEKDPNKAIDFLKNLKSYTCQVNIHIKNQKQEIDTDGNQFYDSKLGHRLELNKDRILIYNNNTIKIKDLNNNLVYSVDKDFDSVYNLGFIHEYIALLYTDEDISSSFKIIENREYQLIRLTIPGNNQNISKAILYVNLENYFPEKLVIYDYKDNEVLNFNYNDFKPNIKIPKEMFYIE